MPDEKRISSRHRSGLQKRFQRNSFLVKLLHWEYWPYQLVYIPVYFYWLWLSLCARSLLFFSSANPGIKLGGLIGDSKSAILDMFPDDLIPQTLLIGRETPWREVRPRLQRAGINFPLIAKPDIGERGFLVEKIEDIEELKAYLSAHPVDMIIQDYVTYPEEVSVLYYRYPNQNQGHISSLTLKEFLSITGDGQSTFLELIEAYPRARFQLERLRQDYADRLHEILPEGEKMQLVSIGNHSRGTTFLNGNDLIDERLVRVFDRINHRLEGLYFGRFDVRCESLESLKKGLRFKILEFNGVKAEPTHIYEPGFSIWEAYRVLFRQWKVIYEISLMNKAMGQPYMSGKEAIDTIRGFHRYRRTAKANPLPNG